MIKIEVTTKAEAGAVFTPHPKCSNCKGTGLVKGLVCDCAFPRDADGRPQ